ncbi:MAG: hypothetical protein HND55_06980 [Pseudomonadota bacterium]|nr:MAG: hypothetical protein HND55_06980 [Pseudomonadota bacterium]
MSRHVGLMRGALTGLRWLWAVMRNLGRASPASLVIVVSALGLARILSLLAFFLPLKVILLAGSDGVPSYSRLLISPETKSVWILGLAVLSVVAYGLTLWLDSIANRLASAASGQVVANANEIGVTERDRQYVTHFYYRMAEVGSGLVFFAASMMVVGTINLFLLLAIVLYMAGCGMLTAAAVGPSGRRLAPAVTRYVLDKTEDYVRLVASLAFLLGFGVILMPFLLGNGPNILLAILAVLILRQAFNALTEALIWFRRLWLDRDRSNPLVFRSRVQGDAASTTDQVFRQRFALDRRNRLVADRLAMSGCPTNALTVSWMDSPMPGATVFHVRSAGREEISHWQLQAYFPRHSYRIDHEDLLFSYVSREQAGAPERSSRFREGQFECQLCRFGDPAALVGEALVSAREAIQVRLWSLVLPQRMIRAYATSSQTLADRLSSDWIDDLLLAAASAREVALVQRFGHSLPLLRARLKAVPLRLHNSGFYRWNMAVVNDDPVLMSWSAWSVEPIGFLLPEWIADDAELARLLDRAARQPDMDPGAALTCDQIRLVGEASRLEQLVRSRRLRAALGQVEQLLCRLDANGRAGDE